jgi:DNA-3-methyladenine glycosylase
MPILSRDFFLRQNVVKISRDLLGKLLITDLNGEGLTAGIITETEAYAGITDKASHAYGNRKTQRTAIMYKSGGTAYVYLCYGMHSLFNVVTNIENIPHAILVRAIKPVEGINLMLNRRKKIKLDKTLSSGPGTLSKALGIDYRHSGLDLIHSGKIWIEDRGIKIKQRDIITGPRIGVDYAGEDAKLPYRFRITL